MANKEGMGDCVIGRILPIWAQIACLPFGGQTPSDWKPNQYANIAQGTKDQKYEQKNETIQTLAKNLKTAAKL